jgi:hypothetical protein
MDHQLTPLKRSSKQICHILAILVHNQPSLMTIPFFLYIYVSLLPGMSLTSDVRLENVHTFLFPSILPFVPPHFLPSRWLLPQRHNDRVSDLKMCFYEVWNS